MYVGTSSLPYSALLGHFVSAATSGDALSLSCSHRTRASRVL